MKPFHDQFERVSDFEPFSLKTDSRFNTASHYLKALHYNDRPTDLMPQDAKWLILARKFYDNLSEKDRDAVNSFSDRELFRDMDKAERNKCFNQIVTRFICTL